MIMAPALESPVTRSDSRATRDASRASAPAAGRWDAVLSIGSSCAIAYHLHRKGLATRTGPLDWFGSHDGESVARMVRTRFNSLFVDRRMVRVVGEHNNYWRVMDAANAVFTLHDFPMAGHKPKPLWKPPLRERLRRFGDRCLEPAWRWLPWLSFEGPDGSKIPLPGWREFHRRVARRVARHVAALESPGPILVIRRARDEREVEAIHSALQDFRGNRRTRLFVLGYEEVYGRDWRVPGLRTAIMPPDDPSQAESWRGRDEDWDRLFEGCEVTGS